MPHNPIFRDRTSAGEQLAQAIHAILTQRTTALEAAVPVVVYALPRGGLPVAAPVARLLGCALDVVVAKKITQPKQPELAIGAVTASGYVLWTRQQTLWRQLQFRQRQAALAEAFKKAQFQQAQLSPACPQIRPGAIAILVDDGIATGMTMAVAAHALRSQQTAAIWLCAPVAPFSLLPWLQRWGDRVILLETPNSFHSVSSFYAKFPQVAIEEALVYLQQQNNGGVGGAGEQGSRGAGEWG